MTVTIYPAKTGGRIEAIASKTHAHRLLICAALYGGKTRINCRTVSEDIQATANCLRAMGVRIIRQPYGYFAEPKTFDKNILHILDCGESGSTYRFLLPVASALGLPSVFKLGGRLPERPMEEFFGVLEEHGAVISGKGTSELKIGGELKPGTYTLPGDISSQYISGLLFALPLLNGQSKIIITRSVESKGYIEATLAVLRSFGIDMKLEGNRIEVPKSRRNAYDRSTAQPMSVEGDWSNAAFWLSAGAVGESPVTVTGLDTESAQGDKAICDILSRFGAKIGWSEYTEDGAEFADMALSAVTVTGGKLKGITVNAADIPDLVPAIAVLAAAAEGETVITNAGRLRYKESDRLMTVVSVLNSLGGNVTVTDDGLNIKGCGKLKGGTVDSFSDHRIAMMAAVASVISAEPVVINRAEAVAKSYPAFFNDFQKLGANVQYKEV